MADAAEGAVSGRNYGGSAFPYVIKETDRKGFSERQWETGMSLRDYFAAMALGTFPYGSDLPEVATNAYKLADEMLKAREAK